jgi:nucleotide-binding universal stress UspA family protein
MNTTLAAILVILASGAGAAGGWAARARRRMPPNAVAAGSRTILLPFTGTSISRRALEAAMRLAFAEDATIMPAYLARVPRTLPLDAALPQQCLRAMPLLEAIEQKAVAKGLAVDARVGRGRTYRDALRHIIDDEPVDRIIVSATSNPRLGLNSEDLDWLLQKVPAEVMILRPGLEDRRRVTIDSVAGHF